MAEIVLYSSTGCEYCKKIKADLTSWGLHYEERNVTENEAYFDDLHQQGIYSVPVTFLGSEPVIGYRPNAMKKRLAELGIEAKTRVDVDEEQAETNAEEVFSSLEPGMYREVYDLVIIGGGPAGSSAAVYAARGRLKTLVIDKAPTAGALALTHKIANYPGVLGEVTGLELLTLMRKQAKQFGAQFVRSHITGVEVGTETHSVHLPDGSIHTKSLFVAVGSRGRVAKVKGEERFEGRGVSYCATCDAAFFEGKTVAVFGDNGEAAEDALTLSRFAKRVHIFLPGKQFGSDVDPVEMADLEHVEIHPNHQLREVLGEDRFEGIVVKGPDGEATMMVDGVFIYLSGNRPGTDFLAGVVDLDDDGYIVVNDVLHTSVPGIFAGGDARRTPVKQAVVAAADGAIAAMSADQFVHRRKRIVAQYS
ncbi:FAD-dependent oxidoreductase [Ferroacidibacillus organovorans]|uniref:Pyridine nucleotide-disulfide oxidoreductase n=1 Tax=Ferroacidibacillus organovorans TaxID=1765683 RepID=A0A1V4ESA1_9BACL|nr:FAD-dependent oxidoreductase [Ferroacidibacillus organovorans]OPG15720.1 pyridine nucleotide-disulfide oxidoreductase [Ferroacidibacillus organovorans]